MEAETQDPRGARGLAALSAGKQAAQELRHLEAGPPAWAWGRVPTFPLAETPSISEHHRGMLASGELIHITPGPPGRILSHPDHLALCTQ